MNRQDGAKRGLQAFVVLAVVALAALAGWYFASGGETVEIEAARQAPAEAETARSADAVDPDGEVGGPFRLVSHTGAQVTDADFRGQYMLIVFGFSFCPDVCPLSLQLVTRTLERLEQSDPEIARRVTPLFVSLDPERDRPGVLRDYIRSFHPRMVGLTGEMDEIEYMAASYAVAFRKVTVPDVEGYLIDHTTNIMLMGPDGGYVTSFSPQTPADLMAKGLRRNVIATDTAGARG